MYIQSVQNRLLKVCYVPATSAGLNRLLYFFFFLWWQLTVLMKQTRQAVCAVKQTILLRCVWGRLRIVDLLLLSSLYQLLFSLKTFCTIFQNKLP
jgi:hypothetical protein